MLQRKNAIHEDKLLVRAIWAVALILLMISCVYPFIYMLALSMVKTPSLKINLKLVMESGLSVGNYVRLFKANNFGQFVWNSIYVSFWTVGLTCLFGSMAGYAFAKKCFPGRRWMFMAYLLLMMIPGQVTLIPKFLITKSLGWINTYTGLILPGIAGGGIILMHQFMKSSLPDELLEAADIDGCGEIGKYVRIVLPLIKPVLVTQAIMTFIACWSDLQWPLLVASDRDMVTLTLGVATLKDKNVTDYGPIMAGNVVAMLPTFIFYMFAQKQFIEGIALSGIKA